MKKRNILLSLMLPVLLLAADGKDLPMEEFVAQARGSARRQDKATYAKLRGVLQHRRRGKDAETMPIYFSTIIHSDRTIGQLVLNGNEGYILSQAQRSGLTTVQPMGDSAKKDKLGYVGVRASDLMMSFLFCKVEKELESESLRGIVQCRVFQFDDPDNKEKIKVWISSEHAFPLKAEFYRYGENKRFRELEAGALTKKNELYYVRHLRLEGPGWITKIDFDNDKSEIGVLPDKVPNIFIPLK
ncbi:MAG: hypothetical protein IJC27_05800 [Lentisphaeria bacterium]|nr:hypothetical protein [Lentisphaeria bacterium]